MAKSELEEIPIAQYGKANSVSVDDMLFEIANQSYAVDLAIDQLEAQVNLLPAQVLRDTNHVFITGCGDSYFAGIAAQLAFHSFTRVITSPIEALEFGRYTADVIPKNSIVLAISNSGKATRTIEALQRATDVGAFSVAITGAPESRFANAARHVLNQKVERDGRALTMPSNLEDTGGRPSFGLSNYLVSLTTLLLIAFRMGEVRGVLDKSELKSLKNELRATARTIDETVEICNRPAQDFASRFADVDTAMIVGAGPGHGIALFYGAKTYELARINGNVQQLEEWAHEQFFVTGAHSNILFVAPPGRSQTRALEILKTASQLKAYCAVVTEVANAHNFQLANTILPVSGTHREEFIGIPYVIPGELFATQVAAYRNHGAFEFDSELQYVLNMTTLQESRIYRPQESGSQLRRPFHT